MAYILFKPRNRIAQSPAFHIFTESRKPACCISRHSPIRNSHLGLFGFRTIPLAVFRHIFQNFSQQHRKSRFVRIPLQKNRHREKNRVRISLTKNIQVFCGTKTLQSSRINMESIQNLGLRLLFRRFHTNLVSRDQIVHTLMFQMGQQVHIRRLARQNIRISLQAYRSRCRLTRHLITEISFYYEQYILAHQVTSRKTITSIIACNDTRKVSVRLF